jgi:hypothetical protein
MPGKPEGYGIPATIMKYQYRTMGEAMEGNGNYSTHLQTADTNL